MQFRHEHCNEESERGVKIERRSHLEAGSWFGWSMAMLLTRMNSGASLETAQAAELIEILESRSFAEQVSEIALEMNRSLASDERVYLRTASKLLDRRRTATPWRIFSMNAGQEMDMSAWFPPVVMYQIRMAPGATISLHDHRFYNGVLIVQEGSAQVRNFDFVQQDGTLLDVSHGKSVPETGEFFIRETRNQVLYRKQSSALTRDRDNMHQVTAGEQGCLLLDFFTHFRTAARSHELIWDDTPVNRSQRIYVATWKSENHIE